MADGSREYSGSYVNGFYRCRIVAEWTNVTEAGFTLTTKTYVDVADYYHDNGDNFDGWAKVGSSSTAWTTGSDTYLTGPTSLLLATKSQYVTRTHTGFNTAVSGGVRNTYNSYYAGPSEASGSVYCSPKSSYTVSYNANNGNSTPNSQTKWALEDLTLASAIARNNSTGTAWTVNFNANGGSSTGASNNKLSASRTTSYTFAGWNTNSSGTGTNYSAGGKYTTDAAVTLYAKWTSSTATGQVTLPTPVRSGYTFNGWYTASSGGTRRGGAGSKWTPNADGVTLYAQWTQNTWTVAYNANGGNSSSVPASQTKTADVTLTLSSTTPTRNTAGNGQYSITYNYNGGSGTPTSASAARTISYAFRRWNTEANGSGTSYNPGGSYTANAGATLYAQWSPTYHTASVTLPTPSARTGYDFGGWYNGTTKVGDSGAAWTPTGSTDSIALTAKWTLKTYPITLNAQEGNVTTTSLTKEYGNALSLPTPTRSGFRFVGWNTASDGTGTNYTSSLPTTFNQSATLYAQWIKASLSTISAFRIVTDPGDDDSEEPDRMGTRGKVTGSWVVDSTMATSTTATVEYKLVTATNWTLVATSTASSAKSGTVSQVITGPLDVGEAYQVRVTLTTSYFTNQTYPVIERVTTISKAFALLTGLAGGTGLAVGAIATLANTFEVALQTVFQNVVEVVQGNITRDGTYTEPTNGDHPIRFVDGARNVLSYIGAHKTGNSPRNYLRLTAVGPSGSKAANVYISASDTDAIISTDCDLGTNLKQSTTSRGYYLKDSAGKNYPGVYDNGSNLWLGATGTASTHHRGETYISTGHNGTSGNATIYVCVPNAANNGGTSYGVYHTGNKPSASDVGALPIGGGTLTDNLTISKAAPLYVLKSTSVDLSKTNNGISSTLYPGLSILDSAGRIAVRLEEVARSDGGNGFNLYARQYNTSGTQTAQLGISGNIAQDATQMTYSVSSPDNFRSAINAQVAGSYATTNCGGYINALASTNYQQWYIHGKVNNSTNTARNGHDTWLVMNNGGPSCWDDTSGATIWQALTNNQGLNSATGTANTHLNALTWRWFIVGGMKVAFAHGTTKTLAINTVFGGNIYYQSGGITVPIPSTVGFTAAPYGVITQFGYGIMSGPSTKSNWSKTQVIVDAMCGITRTGSGYEINLVVWGV